MKLSENVQLQPMDTFYFTPCYSYSRNIREHKKSDFITSATIMKQNDRHSFFRLKRKGNPSSLPHAMLIRVMMSEVVPVSWHWLITVGKDMVKAKTCALYWNMKCPIFDLSGQHGDSSNKLHQMCQLFLSMIADVSSMHRYTRDTPDLLYRPV